MQDGIDVRVTFVRIPEVITPAGFSAPCLAIERLQIKAAPPARR
jgi:hypothetical protein